MFIENENDVFFHCISCHLNGLALENGKAVIYLVSRKLWKLQLANSSYPGIPWKIQNKTLRKKQTLTSGRKGNTGLTFLNAWHCFHTMTQQKEKCIFQWPWLQGWPTPAPPETIGGVWLNHSTWSLEGLGVFLPCLLLTERKPFSPARASELTLALSHAGPRLCLWRAGELGWDPLLAPSLAHTVNQHQVPLITATAFQESSHFSFSNSPPDEASAGPWVKWLLQTLDAAPDILVNIFTLFSPRVSLKQKLKKANASHIPTNTTLSC